MTYSGFGLASYLDYIYTDRAPSYNSFGTIGLIQTPTAQIKKAGNLYFTLTNNDFYRFGALTINPFDWLEASYFYYRPRDIWWSGPGTNYLDKGFSVKFLKKDFLLGSNIAIGLDDFAGTGWFAREYLIATKETDYFNASIGIGWGAYAEESSFKNPLSVISENFTDRVNVSSKYKLGGAPAYDSWFRGPASFIGGLEFFVPKGRGSKIKIEFDPFDYQLGFSTNGTIFGQDFEKRSKKSNINYALQIPLGNAVSFQLSFIKGNTMNISISFGGDFSKGIVKKKGFSNKITSSNIGNNKKMEFYEDLLFNLKKEEIFIQSAEIDENGALRAAISSSKIRSPIIKHSLTGKYATEIAINKGLKINSVESVFINVGTELSSIKTDSKYFNENIPSSIEEAITTSEIFSGKKTQYQRHEFRPIVKFPSFFYGITPALVNHIGDPSQFYYGGIVLRMDSELQLSRRLQINSQINLNMFNNFDEKSNNPDSDLPHVRTDIVQYLQNSEFYIPRLQLDFFNSISKNLFTKFSAGLLEDMYGGFGFEILYKPFYSNLSIGIEAYKVKKRGFKRDFKFLDYETTTGHLNLNYHHPASKILATLSMGTYLAGDNGYTFDISRRLESGFRAGVFFTRTNVSAELFGEGSFDKGFYFQIPIDLFLNDYRGGYMNFRLTPLTRDGGQKLQQGNDLIGIIHDSSYDEVNRDWPAFIQFWE